MSPGTKIGLTALGLVGGSLLAAALIPKTSKAEHRASNPVRPGGAAGGFVSVGASAGAGTHDWWLGRNERRRQKHLRMMTAKG